MYLIIDTETSGLPKDWRAPLSDLGNWPRLVQIAWLQHDAAGKLLCKKEYIIRPEGFVIPAEATKVHGISQEKALKEGLPLNEVLREFSELLKSSQALVAHKLNFDRNIIGAEFLRAGIDNTLFSIAGVCTMKATTDFCKIPHFSGYKWPKLAELHTKLFGTSFEEAHHALGDATACSRCFFELKKRGIIRI